MALSTHNAYEQGINAFYEFCKSLQIDNTWPIDPQLIPHFVAYMSLSGKSYSTVKTYLAGISSKHRLNGWVDPVDSFLVKKLLKGLARSTPQSDTRCPVTFQRLTQLIPVLSKVCKNTYETLLFGAAFTVAFFGFFRLSELIGQGSSLIGGRPGILIDEVQITPEKVIILIVGSKTDQTNNGQKVSLSRVVKTPTVCPAQNLSKF